MAMLMDYAGNHPGKLATLVALSTFHDETVGPQFATHAEVVNRLNLIQGDEPGWDFTETRSLPAAYCRKSLQPAGLVEYGTKVSVKGTPVEAVRLTPLGLTEGLILAGALIPLDWGAPEGASIQGAMGASQQQRANGGGEPSRIAMYRYLDSSPRGVAAAVDLQHAANISQGTASSVVRELDNAGILSSVERSDPANRTFTLNEPPAGAHHLPKHTRADTRAVIKAALLLQAHGKTQVTGAEILELTMLPAGADRGVAWANFTAWVRGSGSSFLSEQTAHDNIALRTRIAITRNWRPFIHELLRVRQLLTSADEASETFRARTLEFGQKLAQRPKMLAAVLGQAEAYSRRGSDDWLEQVAGIVPDEGVSAPDLHRLVGSALGVRITYKKFRRRIGRIPILTITEQPGGGTSGNTISYVTPPPRFGSNWADEAACRDKDPDIFYPEGTHGPVAVAQAERAKDICSTCPVRLPCLKTTLEKPGTKYGVSGGVWWERKPYPELDKEDERNARAVRIDTKPMKRGSGA
jgi:WhiB family redox-sensing transcriptional regulator